MSNNIWGVLIMGFIQSSIILLLAVALSIILSKIIKKISNTYISLIIGAILGLIPITNGLILEFNDEIFMLLIIAPLLFFEGQETKTYLVRKKFKNILSTAIVLAILSAVIGTAILHSLTGITLSMALIIIAISTPTDATAMGSVSDGLTMPPHVDVVLKMESLFNDATGIVLLQAALIWFNTGHLSLGQNISAFLISAIGGTILGLIMSLIFMFIRQFLIRTNFNSVTAQNLIYLMTPFIIYLIAEKIEVSGIIAVVSAGLIFNNEASRSRFSEPRQFHAGIQMSQFLTEILNNFVFISLGTTLIRIIKQQYQSANSSLNWLLTALLVYITSLIIRFLYSLIVSKFSAKEAVVFSFGGIHGSVTLAMAFSVIGASISTGSKIFSFIILVESTVILISMIVPTILFKFILPADAFDLESKTKINRIRNQMVQLGIDHVQKMDIDNIVKQSVIYDLRDQIKDNGLKSFVHQWRFAGSKAAIFTDEQSLQERRALMGAFNTEIEYLYETALKHVIESKYIYDLYSEILLSESLVLDPENSFGR
ncbi:cation:proton antiporter [Companilactobacillus kedongensis]|uniref:cation:proton antiporter n=1 Tax=Companilactobacillus kedongensis TaxID=2486004 RepID=UPI001CDB6845|nr:sodium:proton antiporter [Companilactobacillus kedongensis]